MKFQPKRFVVEVKRGTSRAAFASPDPSADRFSGAEAVLFGGAPRAEEPALRPKIAKDDAPGGRILRSLIEPPPPEVEDPPPPVRRGRKPGSKNRPKVSPSPDARSAPVDVAAERPRRGRKPGSKNKPKSPVAIAFPPAPPGGQDSAAVAMRSYGFTDDGTAWEAPPPSRPVEPDRLSLPIAAADAIEDTPERSARTRLRDRSTILKRYVLDLEPRPGQPGALRARRLARSVAR